jgi:hypothetical protein
MLRRVILDIPVYRLSQDAFTRETDEIRHQYVSFDSDDVPPWMSKSELEEKMKALSEHFEKVFNRSPEARIWKYNEINGYISIRSGSNQVKAEYWFINSKRIGRRTIRKIYEYRGKAFEIWVKSQDSSIDIFNAIRDEVNLLKKRRPFKGRYIDLESFENIGPYLNWKELV